MRNLFILIILTQAHILNAAEFRAGAAVTDITPAKWPVPMLGSFGQRNAAEAWDKLNSRALVLDDDAIRLAIVVVDNCVIPRPLLDEVKRLASNKTGIRPDRMLIAATHTHTAPSAADTVIDTADRVYLEQLKAGIVESVVRASANLEPAEAGWGSASVPEHVFNRRWHMKEGGIVENPFGDKTDLVRMNPPRGSELLVRPAGPTDPEVSILSVRSRDGRPIALLANYSLHYVGGVPPRGVSADYFGEFARVIEQRLSPESGKGHPPFVGMLSNGTSGDINSINFRDPRRGQEPFEKIREVAGRVADATVESYRKIKHHDSVPLAMAERKLTLGVRRPTPAEIERAKRFLAEPDESKLPRRAKAYAQIALKLAEHPPTDEIVLQAIRVGDVGIAAIPCEVFVEIGLEIKEISPLAQTFTMELANGWSRYLPTPRQHRLGGYETWLGSNMLEKSASDKITDTIVQLLHETASTELE